MHYVVLLPVGFDTIELKGCLKGNMMISDGNNAIDLVVAR